MFDNSKSSCTCKDFRLEEDSVKLIFGDVDMTLLTKCK